jgi:hypothetical protein
LWNLLLQKQCKLLEMARKSLFMKTLRLKSRVIKELQDSPVKLSSLESITWVQNEINGI